MAEIKIEKRKSPVWPWILLAVLVIAAVIWWSGDDEPDVVNTEEVVDVGRENDTDFDNFREDSQGNDVQAFVSYIETNGNKIGLSHKYSHDALTHLADALEAIVSENNVDLENQDALKEIRDHADQLKETTSSTQHANILAKASTKAVDIMQNLGDSYPEINGQIEEVRSAAEAINPNAMLTNQKENVHKFFNESAETLEAMIEDA